MIAKAKIAKDGKISIPAACKKALNISTGDELIFKVVDNEIILSPISFSLNKVRQLLKHHNATNKSLVDELLAERKQEQEK